MVATLDEISVCVTNGTAGSGKLSVQVNCSDEAHLVYNVGGQVRNERFECLLGKSPGTVVEIDLHSILPAYAKAVTTGARLSSAIALAGRIGVPVG